MAEETVSEDSSIIELAGLAYIAQVRGEGRNKDKGEDAAAGAEPFQAYQGD